jgi:hypothetical protein
VANPAKQLALHGENAERATSSVLTSLLRRV